MEKTRQWLLDQDMCPYQDDVVTDMACPRCTGRGSEKRSLSSLRLPRIALLEIQTNHFQKSSRPAVRHQPASTLHLREVSSFANSSCPKVTRQKPPKGRAQSLKERIVRLNRRPGNRDSTTNLSCLSSITGTGSSPSIASESIGNRPQSVCSESIISEKSYQISNAEEDNLIQQRRLSSNASTGNLDKPDIHVSKDIEGTVSVPSIKTESPYASHIPIEPNSYNLLDLVNKHKKNQRDVLPTQVNEVHQSISNEEEEVQFKAKTKYTLFEHGFTDDGNPIVFENYVKFHSNQSLFQGFHYNHLKNPETFTMEHDFPSLPALPIDVKECPAKNTEEPNMSLKDLASDLLDRSPKDTSEPACSRDSQSDMSDTMGESPGPPAFIKISNLPPGKLNKENKELFMDILDNIGHIMEFQEILQENTLSLRVKFSTLEECKFATELLDGQGSILAEYVLQAVIEPLVED